MKVEHFFINKSSFCSIAFISFDLVTSNQSSILKQHLDK